jgi:hypothetical protein
MDTVRLLRTRFCLSPLTRLTYGTAASRIVPSHPRAQTAEAISFVKRKLLRQGAVVLFAGSGISRAARIPTGRN